MNIAKTKKKSVQSGFTMVEMLVIIVVLSILFGIITINFSSAQGNAYMSTVISNLISDIKEQQMKAMVGDTEGRSGADKYGIYFGSTNYTLFHGSIYSSADTANFLVKLDGNLQFASSGGSIIFSQVSGEIINYSSSAATIILQDVTTNTQKSILLNKFGVITGVN